ncbi:short transient receptor potential channel 4-like isoform X2 [Stylophora pistillata]|uniref:short transient receptor potential channel 4-like isoform X2 n=1 Tax=Stylophora pistillata TaxID=50429 RepID=UPI000C04252E|nr:short transient receptor potential channel 4-like isoform X2 [Stylophora pistillata]
MFLNPRTLVRILIPKANDFKLKKSKRNLMMYCAVTKILRDLAHEGNPEKDDIQKLEKSLNEFTSALIDPLKAHDDFQQLSSGFDQVIDKAIDTKQKKFIAHPMVYDLLNSTWYGSFSSVRTESWRKPGRWGYFFLNLWTVFDFVLFPLLFAIFFAVHLFKQALRNRRGIEEKDIYEKYKEYFTTPYFIFFRDTLSYLTLLGLHFAICLSPSTISFSALEWVIFVFFLGRILMEVDEFIRAKTAGVKARTIRERNYDKLNHQEENGTAENDDILLKKFLSYFSDRWNVLDLITLFFYLITFILRMITWSNSTDVSNNRFLAVAEYFYGFIAMVLALRTFGQVMECKQKLGPIQIALFSIIRDVFAIFWQGLAIILAFSLAITKIYVTEKAYTSGKDSAEDLACGESGIICWWNMATHLSWSLLGLGDLDKLNSVDNPSAFMVRLLYSFFLIIAVILLVNMMIALLSNTYQHVQNNSLQEWSFKKAITVRTYSTYHPIPVPFNILSIPLKVFWRTHFDSPALDEEGRSDNLDKLVDSLQTIYFEKYGYEFPLTEEKKIDHLIQENEGNRKMTSQIARQVFKPLGNKEEKLAFGQGAWYDSQGIAVDGCLLTYLGPKFCHDCNGSSIQVEEHSAKFNSPFTPETPRLEVLIQETGERRSIGLGVVYEDYNHHNFPGWRPGTVGYHVDDGNIFEGVPCCGREVEGAMAHRGDLIACEVDFEGVHDGRIPVLFFLNGKEVARSSLKYTSGQKLIPSVALAAKGITVLAKMCHRDGDPSRRVTNEDLQEKIDLLQEQLAELKKLVQVSMEVKEKKEPTSL